MLDIREGVVLNNSNLKSRNKIKASKAKKKMFIRTSQNISRRRPVQALVNTISPNLRDQMHQNSEQKIQTDEEMRMMRKIGSLKSTLQLKDKRLKTIKDRAKSKDKHYKKLIRENNDSIECLEYQVQELKL